MELAIYIAVCIAAILVVRRFFKLQEEPFTTNSTNRYDNTKKVEEEINNDQIFIQQ